MTDRELLEELRRLQAETKPAAAPATVDQKIRASTAMRVVQGARDPIDAGAQLLPKGLQAVTGLFGLAPNPVSEYFGSEARRVTGMNNQAEADYQAAREATGQTGFDGARVVGNIVSPANLAVARVLPLAPGSTAGAAARTGAAGGAVGGVLQPVADSDDGFWTSKALQGGTGAVIGGVLAPVTNALGNRLATALRGRERMSADRLLEMPEIQVTLKQEGIDPGKLSTMQLERLRDMAQQAADKGQQLDVVAALRQQDFDALGVPSLRGQVTRDPAQFARERNLRGVEGVGEPIMMRLNEQNRRLAQLLQEQASGATSPYEAGRSAATRLKGIDEALQTRINALYDAARDTQGRYAPVNVKAFSEAANNALDSQMLGSSLPTPIRTLLNDVSSGKIPLDVNNLVQMDKVLSAAQRGASSAEALAIGQVRTALNNAPIEDAAGSAAKAAFDVARTAARRRFNLQDAVPALKAAAEGEITPERFVTQYVTGGKVDEVQRLMKLLGPEEQQQAAKQVADWLQTQAFGANPAGDALFTPSRFQTALTKLGPERLEAVFGKQSADQLQRIARVGGYINQTPGAAAVNTSNTAGAVLNLLQQIPLIRSAVGPAKATVQAVLTPLARSQTLANAINQQMPTRAAPLTPEAAAQLARALSLAGPLGGAAFAPRL
jgi:hypothetical protein